MAIVLSLTFDTSCALNFLGEDETTSDALIELMAAAIDGRVSVRVTDAAYAEVGDASEGTARDERLKRLRTFGRLKLPDAQADERDALARQFHTLLFPRARATSRTNDHNHRDCLQLVTHKLIGREIFVTLDKKLERRVQAVPEIDVTTASPDDVLRRLTAHMAISSVASVPALGVRDADVDRDEASIRAVLTPLADDYPDFNGWLTRALHEARSGRTRIRIGEAEGRVGAVALSKVKDRRIVKLSAFYVADWARDHGLGQHVLWSEIRSWAGASVEKVYVTVSSRHAELIDFFRRFGFLVEGVSPRRYQHDTSELVLGRHFVRAALSDTDLGGFVLSVASRVFAPPRSVTLDARTWALSPPAAPPAYDWHGEGADLELVETVGSTVMRSWDLLALETTFYPLRVATSGRPAMVVPIRPLWAEAMLGYEEQQLSLLADSQRPGRLLLRADNAYYCWPTALGVARPGTPIIFLVTGGRGLVGEAKVLEAVVGEPEDLYLKFGGLGIYGVREIRSHVRPNGPNKGRALALRFGHYVPYGRPVSRDEMSMALGRDLQVQTITPIAVEEFEILRRMGGLTW